MQGNVHLMQHIVWLYFKLSWRQGCNIKPNMLILKALAIAKPFQGVGTLSCDLCDKEDIMPWLVILGPMKCNGCPLRRVNQIYLLATSTKVDVSGVNIPEHINDEYFRRAPKKANNKEGDIFESKKEEYKPSEQRKTDQQTVDKQILDAIKKHSDGKMLRAYLRHTFGLDKGQYPHEMGF